VDLVVTEMLGRGETHVRGSLHMNAETDQMGATRTTCNRDLDDPTDRTHAGLFRGFILRNPARDAHLSYDVRLLERAFERSERRLSVTKRPTSLVCRS
jgi:hypothetical protein